MNIIVAGDFAPRARLAKQVRERAFDEIFPKDLVQTIKSADFSFVNLECPIIDSGFLPIDKCGPSLSCTENALLALKYAGFTGVTLANNHILDYGIAGLNNTLTCCSKMGLDVVGVGDNIKDAEKYLLLEAKGKKIAILNCCEHEFSIATEDDAGANHLNAIRQFYSIEAAKKIADYVLVIVHGGHEHYQLPSSRMVDTYRFFIDIGADAVVNHHQHCYSGYEIYNKKPIFYGLGNFCFDINPIKEDTTWNYGYVVNLSFEENVTFDLFPYKQYGNTPSIQLLESDSFNLELSRLNLIIADRDKLLKENLNYYKRVSDYEMSILEPYSGGISYRLLSMNLLPRFVQDKKLLMILNHISCESHRDKLLFALKNRLM